MCKGMKYNFKVISPQGEEHDYKNLYMNETIENIKNKIKEIYNIDMNMSNQVIYNLKKRPEKANLILRNSVKFY